jgi:hypothetical protein
MLHAASNGTTSAACPSSHVKIQLSLELSCLLGWKAIPNMAVMSAHMPQVNVRAASVTVRFGRCDVDDIGPRPAA